MSKTRTFTFSMMVLVMMLGAVAVSSFGAVTISLEQLSPYDPNNHYTTAVRKGTDNVPILRVTIGSDAVDTWTSLTLTYTGTRISDVGTFARLYNSSGTLVKESAIVGETVTFTLGESIPAGNISYDVKLDVVSGAGSNKIDLKYDGATFQSGIPTLLGDSNPAGYVFVDASPPALDTYSPITKNGNTATGTYYGWYDIGTKILRLRFYDKLNPEVGDGKVVNPLVRLVFSDASDHTTQGKVDLSNISLRTPDNSPSVALTGATLLRPGLSTDVGYDSGAYTGPAGSEFFKDPHDKGDNYFSSEVWIKLTPDQDATLQNSILTDDEVKNTSDAGIPGSKIVEIYIGAGTLTDAGNSVESESKARDLANDFGNAIEKHDDNKYKILVIGDTEPPTLIADRPVKFNHETKVLTLTFNESVDATPVTDVDLAKLTIRAYKFDENGNVIIDTKKEKSLVGATVTEGHPTTLTITLTSDQRDILKSDKPELVIDAGAIKDVAGNPIDAVSSVNVFVTPLLLSNVESKYEGAISGANASRLTLTFSNEIQRQYTDPTKIILANAETGGDNFPLTPAELAPLGEQPSDVEAVAFDLNDDHRNTLAGWQKDKDIYVRFDADAVQDKDANTNAKADKGEKITWVYDNAGPNLLDPSVDPDLAPSYDHYTRELTLHFDEAIRVQYGDDGVTPVGEKVKIQTDNATVGAASQSVTLSKDERISGQSSGTKIFKFKLTQANADAISAWRAGSIKVQIDAGAVEDISKERGTDNYSKNVVDVADIPDKNWTKDTTAPVLQSAVYSPDARRLSLRFNEAMSTVVAEVLKGSMRVHSATNSYSLADNTETPVIEGDTIMITVTGTDKDQHKVIVNSVAPQVTIDIGAVRDAAGNLNSSSATVNISKDSDKPVLSTTGNSYKHEHDPSDNDPWLKGILTLTFAESVDVSTLTDLSKISLKAGNATVALDNDVAEVTTTADGTTVVIKTKNNADAQAKVNEISGLGRDYDTLYVEIAAEAIKDMAGNKNALISQALNTWTKDSVKPTLDAGASYYVHDAGEAEAHRTWLVLKFKEQMDTRASYITAANIEIANQSTGGDSITLTQDEIPTQGFANDIVFYISEEHRDIISKWGAPDSMGDADHQGFDTLYVRLSADAVSDRGGNGNATMNTRSPLGTWTKDTVAPEYSSSAYDANTKKLTITFKEWMDAKPTSLVDPSNLTITDADGANGVNLSGAGIAETDKTKTITVTLTPAQDMDVKPLKKALELDMAVGAAKDIAGNDNAAVADKAITYTEDTTPPGLDKEDDGRLKSHYWHADQRLELDFNEAIDRDYTDIDATKVTLSSAASGGESFALTQAEIERKQPGDIVLPDPPNVDKIRFKLSNEHWNTVAGWSAIYVQIDAGAVKDTTTANVIPAIGPTQIHPDNVKMDTTPPDVRLPESYVSSAAVGTDVTITATVTDDISVKSVQLWYQVGGEVPTFVMMTGDGSTYTATIPATAVTNKGLSYYVLAEDHTGNQNIVNSQIKTRKGSKDEWWYTNIPGGFNINVTGASVTLAAGTLPVLDLTAVPSRYRMISVPINKSVSSTELFAPFGEAGVDWKAWQFTGQAENNGYQPGHSDGGFTLSSGKAAWIGTVNPDKALTVSGSPLKIAADNNDYKAKITLNAGWNQIAVPYNFSRNWDERTLEGSSAAISDKIYWFTGETSAYSFASTNPTVPNQTVFAESWKTAADFEGSATGSDWPGTLDPWGGYWVYSEQQGAVLNIDPTAPGKIPPPPSAPSVQMPYNWSVKLMAEADGISGASKFAGIVADATDGIDKYDVMDLPQLPGQVVRLSFITEAGDYLQDMRAPSDEMFWQFKVSSANMLPVTIRFDASAVPPEYRTVMLIDTATEASIDLRKATSYAYKPSEKIRNFKLIISKAHPEAYIIPKRSALLQNYPNPFNPETWVPYKLSKAGDVTIKIYNVAGQLVRTLELGHREAGSYTVRERAAYWDGKNVSGEQVASGMYFYYIQAGSFHAVKKMVILK